jgi:hypothetical protein
MQEIRQGNQKPESQNQKVRDKDPGSQIRVGEAGTGVKKVGTRVKEAWS